MAKIKVVKPHKEKSRKPKTKLCDIFTPQLIAQALVILAVFGVLIFALPKLPQMPSSTTNVGYQGVISLWLVDSFEGGGGSRKTWFTTRSAYFEKQNKGLFVCVTSVTEDQLLQNIQSGQTFDILCFSRGIGSEVLDMLCPLNVDTGGVFDNFSIAGKLKNTTYALPVYSGAYCLFARESQQNGDVLKDSLTTTFVRKVGKNIFNLQPLVTGFTSSNSPFTALAMGGVKGEARPDYKLSQYDAYEQFVSNKKAVTLLGTQRDLYRLSQKMQLGKIEQLRFAPLCSYTDLVQFVGINKNSEKISPCEQFVEYLLSDTVQQSLTSIAMFSVTKSDLYRDEWYSACERALPNAYVPNVFADNDAIFTQRQTAISTLKGS